MPAGQLHAELCRAREAALSAQAAPRGEGGPDVAPVAALHAA
jgi:hypothetical protein